MFTQLRWRMVRWNLAVFGLILIAVGGSIYGTAARRLPIEVDRELENRVAALITTPRVLERDEFAAAQGGYRGGYFFLILGRQGEVLANPQQVTVPELSVINLEDPNPQFYTLSVRGEPVRLYAQSVPTQPTLPPGVPDRRLAFAAIVVGQSLVPMENALRRLLIGLIVGGAIGSLLLVAAAWFLAGRALIPIETAFRRQQEFIADASHELRTPLTVLRSSADLLDRHRAEPLTANGEIFDDLRDGLGRLERLANDLLTLARSDLGEQTLAVAPLDLGSFAAEVARQTMPLAQAHNLRLICEGPDEELPVEADPDRLHQVLLILIDNAIAHTPAAGTLTIGLARQGAEAVLTVHDTGEGIPADDLARIFDRFYRADGARSRTVGGAGLGLAIARALVESHGGRIALSSSVGQGTTATIYLPLIDQPPTLADRLGQLAARTIGRERT